jgi:hypothetical protein
MKKNVELITKLSKELNIISISRLVISLPKNKDKCFFLLIAPQMGIRFYIIKLQPLLMKNVVVV